MTKPTSPARWATAAGLGLASLGLITLKLVGVDMPPVPPALVLLVPAAVLVAVVRRRWVPIVAILAALFELFGFFSYGAPGNLLGADSAAVAVAEWSRLAGAVTAIGAGAVATWQEFAGSAQRSRQS